MSEKRSLHILLVDDEQFVRQTLGDYLRESGHHVDEACDGSMAVRLIEGSDHDLALVDVRMPGMDGFDLLAKAEGLRPDMSVVMITGHADMELAIQALRLGAADFLSKPVKLEELDAVLEKSLRLRSLRRDRRRLREVIRGIQSPGDVRSAEGGLVGASPATQKLRQQICEVVESGCETILITGETGTGKPVRRDTGSCSYQARAVRPDPAGAPQPARNRTLDVLPSNPNRPHQRKNKSESAF